MHVELPATTQEFKLQPAYVDVKTGKTQGTLAAPLAAIALLGMTGFHIAGADAFGALALRLFDAVVVGVIAAEVTGRYGNRLAAAASVWAALIYCVLVGKMTTGPLSLESAATPFFLVAVFGYLRYRTTREKWVLRAGLAFSALGLFTSLVSTTAPLVTFAAEALPHTDPTGSTKRRGNNWMAVALFFLVLFFVGSAGVLVPDMVPVLKHRSLPGFSIQNLSALVAPSLPAGIAAAACVAPGAVLGGWQVLVFCAAWMLLASSWPSLAAAPLAIALATLALPATRTLPSGTTKFLTFTGLAALTVFVFLHV